MLTGNKGLIFNVVHGSFVDGWGIRTTVFLKGCPLRCRWCCNPESQSPLPELRFVREHCSLCGRCVPACPRSALTLETSMLKIDRARCDGCGKCLSACWPGALELWGKERTAEDVFAECRRDAEFYRQSGGGVTLSGGEPTLQPEFCLELMDLCADERIPVAVDTCGQITTERGLEVLRRAGLILFDVKGVSPLRHRENTGAVNDVILRNLQNAEEWGKEVIVRYPAVPGCNLDEARDIAELLRPLHCVRRVDIIPYHVFGTGKYAELGRAYPLPEEPLSQAEAERTLALFQSIGLPTQLGG